MKELIEDIRTGHFRRVYLLYGEEAYLLLQYRRKLCDAIVPQDDSMNRTVYEGRDISEGEVIDLAETMPLFSEHRLILLKDTGFFKSSPELLPDYLKNVPDYLTLVFSESEVDKRSRMFKAVRDGGLAVEFARQEEGVLRKWVLKMLADAGRRITADDMSYFLSRIGSDMGTIRTETDKLIFYTAGREAVTRQDIDAVTGQETENRIFDMIGALAAKDRKTAFELYADLLALKEAPMRILYLIARQYNQMLIAGELSEKGEGAAAIASEMKLPSFAVRKYLSLLQHYTKKDLEGIIEDCVRKEEDVKSGRMADRLSVELLLISLT